jgi:hypothetical protein
MVRAARDAVVVRTRVTPLTIDIDMHVANKYATWRS